MSFMADWTGRKAYKLHIEGNQLSDKQEYERAQEKHLAAAELYQKAVDGGMNKAVILMAYGVLLLRFGRYSEAREIMLRVEKMPNLKKDEKKQLRLNYAICLWKMGELDRAIEQMKYASGDGKNSMIYGSLGYMLIEKARQTGDFTEAEAFNLEALDYDDEDAVVLDNLGQMYLSMGDREKAFDFFKRAHEEKPSQVDTLYYLSRLYAEDGEIETAKKMLTRALSGNYSALCTTTREQAEEALKALENR
ncbi:MAG: tetratricopeptide repeat protein [Christensenellales bacterium]|jgi:tetratricopeptide (TPR) repeat protein